MKFLKLMLAIACLSAMPHVYAADADAVATVNGKPIKKSWVDFILKDAEARSGQKANDNMKAAIINELVGSELAYQEAQKAGIDKLPDFIASEELARRKLLVNAFLADFIKKNPVTEAEKKEGYEQYKKELGDKEYSARHILVKTDTEAKAIIAELKKGTDFAKLAKDKSLDPGSKDKGGDLGWFSPAGMVKPFADALVAMKKGDVTQEPVQSQFGWHVIKLVDTRALQAPAYEKVQEGIERTIQQRKLEKFMLSLKDKSKIEVTGLEKK
ncbi:MAG TPA: peptidylprolyl isomerase [Methylophilus sp.]